MISTWAIILTEYNIIFGGGKFGEKFIKNTKDPILSLIIDTDPSCLLAKQYPKIDIDEFIKMITLNNSFHCSDYGKDNIFFYVGDIRTAYKLISTKIPKFLVPTAPIHIIFEVIRIFIKEKFPDLKIKQFKPKFSFQKPDEMFIFSFDKYEIYFSYADWDEICPDNCPSPLGYCPFHKRNKPITISDFLEQQLSKSNYFGFKSTQIGAGYGGIDGNLIKNQLDNLFNFIKQNSNHFQIEILIGTSCNCHGVLSGLKIIKED